MMTHMGSLISPLAVGLITQIANGRSAGFALAIVGWAGLAWVLVFLRETGTISGDPTESRGTEEGDERRLIAHSDGVRRELDFGGEDDEGDDEGDDDGIR